MPSHASRRALSKEQIDAARRDAGAAGAEPLLLIVSKYTEIRSQLPALLEEIRALSGVRAAIKTHPAETPAPYQAAAEGVTNVRVLPATSPLAPLLKGAQLVITVNSTVAIDGLALGIPALIGGAAEQPDAVRRRGSDGRSGGAGGNRAGAAAAPV